MRARLAALGVGGVQARTFHAAALRQVRYFAPRLLGGPGACPNCWTARPGWSPWPPPGPACGPTGPPPATWPVRSSGPSRRLVEPGEYVVAAAKAPRETPHEPAKVAEVFAAYEQVKRGQRA